MRCCWRGPKAHGGPGPSTPRRRRRIGNGFYIRDSNGSDSPGFTGPDRRVAGPAVGERWQWGGIEQASTVLSLLTPEYQKRYVQMLYHETVDNFETVGMLRLSARRLHRWWAASSRGGNFELTVTPTRVRVPLGIAANFLREVLTPRTRQKVPQWYGRRWGFWDGETLISWTANVQGWNQHTMFRILEQGMTVETFKPPTMRATIYRIDH